MEKNVGGWDRIVRIVFGCIFILIGVAGYAGMIRAAFGPVPQALAAVIIVLVGLVLLFTGVTQRCMLNKLVGWNTYQ